MPRQLFFSLLVVFICAHGFLSSFLAAAAEPQPLACPRDQVTWLEGTAPPGEALLIYLADQAVGGGSSGPDGRWRLPLRVNEPPGSYPVEVRSRTDKVVYASFLCFVDQPVENVTSTIVATNGPAASPGPRTAPTSSSSATPGPAGAAPTSSSTPSLTPTQTQRPGSSATPSPTATATSRIGSTPTATTQKTAGTLTPTTTATTQQSGRTPTATPTRTPTTSPGNTSEGIEIVEVYIGEGDEGDPDAELGYALIQNAGPNNVNIRNWRLINLTRNNLTYIFPDLVLVAPPPDNFTDLYLNAGRGDDDLVNLELFWGLQYRPWQSGDRIELRDAANQRVGDEYVVP